MAYVTIRYERSKLYEEVWAEPVTKVAKNYEVSDVALRKVCKKLMVPVPPLGYWAKVEAGKKTPVPALPKYAGPTEIIRQHYVRDDANEPDPEHLIARRAFESRPENQIVVPDKLDAPHPLVVAAERALNGTKRRDTRNLPSTDRRTLDISVSEASIPRALRIMDALAKGLEAREMALRIDGKDKRYTCVTIEGQELAIRILENTVRTERELTAAEIKEKEQYGYVYARDRYAYEPTGLLRLGVLSEYNDELKRVVGDGKHQKIEQLLNSFIVKLVEEAVSRKRADERREEWHRQWEETQRRQAEREARHAEETAKLESLEGEVRDWRRAQEIRAYVETVEAKAIGEHGAIDPKSELGEWIKWARKKADWIDPTVAATDPILDPEGDDD